MNKIGSAGKWNPFIRFFLLFLFFYYSDAEAQNVTTDLVGHYTFCDCTARDNSGNSRDGTIIGTPQCIRGIRDFGLLLNQTQGANGCGQPGGQYVSLPALGAIWDQGFTVGAWVRFDEVKNFERIIDFGNSQGENNGLNIWFGREGNSDNLTLESWINADGNQARTTGRLVAVNAITNGKIEYYAATISGDTMRIYVDGVLKAEKRGNPILNVARANNFIGRSNWCSNDPDFKGFMDEVRIYNRALSQQEIKQLFEIRNLTDFTLTPSCGTRQATFSVQNTMGVDSLKWNFGDGTGNVQNTGSGTNVSHTYTDTGTYTVQMIAYKQCLNDTVSKPVRIVQPTFEKSSVSLCSGQSYTLWSGAVVAASGVYGDTLRSISGCDSAIREVTVAVVPAPVSSVTVTASKLTITSGSPVTFTATVANVQPPLLYHWYKNNQLVGTHTSTYTDDRLSNKDSIWVSVTGVNACAELTTVFSNRIVMTVNDLSCTSSLGDPIVNVTFGAGANFGPPIASTTNMQYLASACPNDGQYTIANFSSNCYNNSWHTVTDHTGDANGYFMLVNASFTPSDFYVQTVSGLCSGTTYQFSAWVANVVRSSSAIMPDITFSIETTDGTVLQRNTTGDIPATGTLEWKQFGFFFMTPPGISTVVIRMTNNAPGGIGNDLALDDIAFRPAGPLTTIRFQDQQGDSLALCDQRFSFVSEVENCYPTAQYQWQERQANGDWTDIPGATNQQLSATVSAAGLYKYRLLVSQAGNIQLAGCRVVSNTLTVKVHPPAINVQVDTAICEGQPFTLSSGVQVTTGGIYTDTLRYREGCDSAVRVITLRVNTPSTLASSDTICQNQRYSLPWGQTVSAAGTYRDTLHYTSGCDSLIRTVTLAVKEFRTLSNAVTICPGGQFQLPWGPVVGSTGIYRDTLRYTSGCDSLVREVRLLVMQAAVNRIDGAICTGETYRLPWGTIVSTAGIYRDTVKSSNGCDSLVNEVRLAVNNFPVVSLSKSNDVDCKLGVAKLTATGGSTYSWSPAASLSGASVANPAASPRQTTTYHVQVSKDGCTVEDSITVFVSFANAGQGFYVPSAFSPNGDGKNDCFGVPHWGAVDKFHLQIFNRWGEVVFQTRTVSDCWDGTYKGQMQGPAVFVYLITAETICGNVERKGTITVIR